MHCPQRVIPSDKSDDFRTDRWPEEWPSALGPKPKVCSYCGCIDIADAISMIKNGWEISPTTKSYKWYLEPPGEAIRHRLTLEAITSNALDSLPTTFRPSSPLKVYSHHATPEQINELNALYDIYRRNLSSVKH